MMPPTLKTSASLCLLACLALPATACKSENGGGSAPKSSKIATAVPSAPMPAADETVAKALAALAECKWLDDDESYDEDCEAIAKWDEMLAAADEGDDYEERGKKRAATIIRALTDSRLELRRAASSVMSGHSNYFETDPVLAGAVVAAFSAETDAQQRDRLVQFVADIDVTETKLGAAILAAYRTASDEHKASLIGALADPSCQECVTLLFENAESAKDETLRRSALSALPKGLDDSRACKAFTAALDDNEYFAASTATQRIGQWKEICADQIPAVLEIITRHAADKTLTGATLSALNSWVLENHALNKEQLATVLAAARKTAETSPQGVARSSALELLARRDPGSRAFIAKFAKDDFLADGVKRLLAEMDAKAK